MIRNEYSISYSAKKSIGSRAGGCLETFSDGFEGLRADPLCAHWISQATRLARSGRQDKAGKKLATSMCGSRAPVFLSIPRVPACKLPNCPLDNQPKMVYTSAVMKTMPWYRFHRAKLHRLGFIRGSHCRPSATLLNKQKCHQPRCRVSCREHRTCALPPAKEWSVP